MKDNEHRDPSKTGRAPRSSHRKVARAVEFVPLRDLFPQVPAEPVEEEGPKVWIHIEQQGSNLVVWSGGQEIGTYPRTQPANPADPGAWAQELVTDVTQLTRLAVSKVARRDPEATKFTR